jgi:hypothetical protein
MLLSVTSSPGTAFTRTSIGTFCPVGGCLVSGMITFLASPAAISGIVSSTLMASLP